jgi:hypothetical protein
MPAPSSESLSVVATDIPSLSGEDAQLLAFAASIEAGSFAGAQLRAVGEFGTVLGEGRNENGKRYSFTLQLRPVPPLEVPGTLEEFCRIQGLVDAAEPGRKRGSRPVGFAGLPVILLACDDADTTDSKVILHGAIFEQQDATFYMPRGACRPRWEGIIAAETCGVASLSPSRAAQRNLSVELPAHGGALSCLVTSAENGSYSFAFKGQGSLEGRTVWFAILDSNDDEVLAQGRSDGSRAQGSVELKSDSRGSVGADYPHSFSLPKGGRLIFILEPKTKG